MDLDGALCSVWLGYGGDSDEAVADYVSAIGWDGVGNIELGCEGYCYEAGGRDYGQGVRVNTLDCASDVYRDWGGCG